MKMSNEDRWLINRWEKVKQIEDSMAKTRGNFEKLYEDIHKNVWASWPILNRMDIHWKPNEIEKYGGNVIFSKESWLSDLETWRSGIYVERTSLDELTSESIAEPDIYIYFLVKRSDSRIEECRKRLIEAAPKILGNKIKSWSSVDEEDNRTLLWYMIPEGKKRLLSMIQDGHEKEFGDCIADHVGIMAGFIPILEEFFS